MCDNVSIVMPVCQFYKVKLDKVISNSKLIRLSPLLIKLISAHIHFISVKISVFHWNTYDTFEITVLPEIMIQLSYQSLQYPPMLFSPSTSLSFVVSTVFTWNLSAELPQECV